MVDTNAALTARTTQLVEDIRAQVRVLEERVTFAEQSRDNALAMAEASFPVFSKVNKCLTKLLSLVLNLTKISMRFPSNPAPDWCEV